MSQTINNIPFHKPSITARELANVVEVLKSKWVTTGNYTNIFEHRFKKFVKGKYASAVSSATAGLFLSLKAIDVNNGSTVLTTPYTFVSTAEVVEWIGADLMFVDINDEYNMDKHQLLKTVEEVKLDAIIPIHINGCEINPYIFDGIDTPIISDSAHLMPGLHRDNWTTSVYSFYATKPLTTGEGGMVVTNHEEIYNRIERLKFHGIDRNAYDRYTSIEENKWMYDIVELGYKFNMPDILAAIGLVQLDRQKELEKKRFKIAKKYIDELSKVDYIEIPKNYIKNVNITFYLFQIRVDKKIRNDIIKKLTDAGIGTSVHFIPLHMMTYYREKYGYKPEDFPVAKDLYERSISIPIYPDMTDEEVEKVIEALKT